MSNSKDILGAEKLSSLITQGDKILKEAKKYGCEKNFLFQAQFDIYLFQLKLIENLKETIVEEGMTVTKQYVKNRKNVYSHPALKDLTNTINSANGTVKILLNILKTHSEDLGEDKKKKKVDPILEILNGSKKSPKASENKALKTTSGKSSKALKTAHKGGNK